MVLMWWKCDKLVFLNLKYRKLTYVTEILDTIGWDIPNLYAKSRSISPHHKLHSTKNSLMGVRILEDPLFYSD